MTRFDQCSKCSATYEQNKLIFDESVDATLLLKESLTTDFDLQKFSKLHEKMDKINRDSDESLSSAHSCDYGIDYKCANCILEFTKLVVAYLN